MRGLFLAAMALLLALPALAHDFPRSQVALRAQPEALIATVTVSIDGLGYESPAVLLDGIAAHRGPIGQRIARRLVVHDGDRALVPALESVAPIEEGRFARLRLRYPWRAKGKAPAQLAVQAGALFPNEPTHQTFVSVYGLDGQLIREAVLRTPEPQLSVALAERLNLGAVFTQFVREGVHHIFLGPDHILFLVGLLLLGGGLRRLVKIVTAFTLAHSLTLALATLNVLNPPARLVEPTIALSIVFVGIHTLARRPGADLRIAFAFGFGLIHGFGFASVLQEMELPRAALGLSLAAFNLGVEIGQLCIVLAVAPALAWLGKRHPEPARKLTVALAWLVVFAGAFWLGQRLAG